MCVPRLMNSLVVRHVDNNSLPPNDPTEQHTNVKLGASTARDRTVLATHGAPRNSRLTSSPASLQKRDDSRPQQRTPLYEIRHRTQNRSPDPELVVCQATQRKDRRHPRHHPSRKPQVLCGPCPNNVRAFRRARAEATQALLSSQGDFNSRHAYWDYPDSSAAGRILLDLAHTHHLSLLSDVSTPTRTGNPVQRDTNPDLAWSRTRKTPDWRNLGETFGRDHFIFEITVPLPNRQRRPKRGYYSIATKLTDWDAFRKVTTKFQTSTLDASNHSFRTAHRQTTKTVQRNEDNPQIDRHLVTLWDKRHALIRRWKRNKLNKRLRARIEEITQEAQEYADKLATDNWLDICEHAGNNQHTSRAWSLFARCLYHPNERTT
ncbi:hypothetical protein HPB49_016596 [Dermacentor silvarum]|uniref:Uncharacterized protein n=1 Tax=Dermacentor silvarum TaxID=543639 RepID=A0ACB8CAA2_DERSI|nr:hypothetical protein HPB49_016596 [Dermacentor silvarum]